MCDIKLKILLSIKSFSFLECANNSEITQKKKTSQANNNVMEIVPNFKDQL